MTVIPPGYTLFKKGRSTIIIKEKYRSFLLRQGIETPYNMASFHTGQSDLKGRGKVVSIPIEGMAGEKMIIRKYLRGGLMRFVNHDIYRGRSRAEKELEITVYAEAQGIPVPEVLAAVTVKMAGPFYRAYLVTRELSGFSDLPAYLSELAENSKNSFIQNKTLVLKNIATAVRLMHDRGFYHGDLNLKNILVNHASPEQLYIIDWDKSIYYGRLEQSKRNANIRRFCRSMVKFSCKGLPLNMDDQVVFLKTYWQGIDTTEGQVKKDLRHIKISTGIRKIFY